MEGEGPRPLDEFLERFKPPGAVRKRLLDLPPPDADEAILYQHSVLCQTCLPFRDPGEEIRTWERANRLASLAVAAGQAFHPDTRRFMDIGLPYAAKPRLVLYHLNAEALRTQSPVIELEDSLTAFVKRTLGLDPKGRNIRTVKDQLTRLSAADFRIGTIVGEGRAVTLKGSVIEGFELWVARDPQRRLLWPTTVQFSQRYFESLMKHAVPLNETAIARLSHNAMALDIYTWLAQRLHRIGDGKSALVPWTSLWEKFGHGYAQIRQFRAVFVCSGDIGNVSDRTRRPDPKFQRARLVRRTTAQRSARADGPQKLTRPLEAGAWRPWNPPGPVSACARTPPGR